LVLKGDKGVAWGEF
jgi:hypothetical protein